MACDRYKRARPPIHAHTGGRRTGLCLSHGRERAQLGASCLIDRHKALALSVHDDGKCPTFSGVASFSSSLKGLFVVQGFRVADFRGLRDGAKSTTPPPSGASEYVDLHLVV